MTGKLVWDQSGERLYETGVSQCALYPMVSGAYPKGVAWNGITAITESPSGAESTPMYADNIKYLDIVSTETYAATIEAYMYGTRIIRLQIQTISGLSLLQSH